MARIAAMKQAVVVLGFGLVVVVLILFWSFTRAQRSVTRDSVGDSGKINLTINRALDSPLGFIPEAADTTSGMVTIAMENFGAAPAIEKTVAYYIQTDGTVYFDMLPDDTTVMPTLAYLAKKTDDMTADEAILSASRFMRIDFASLFNYDSLRSQYPVQFNGLLAAYENSTSVKGANGDLRPNKASQICSSAAQAAQTALSHEALNTQRIPTNNAIQSTNDAGEPVLRFTIAPTFFTDIDKSVADFISECYVESAAEAERSYLLALIAAYTEHPTYVFTITAKTNGTMQLEITSQYAAKDDNAAKTGPSLRFTTLPDKAPAAPNDPVVAKSFVDRPNQYALTYSYCRVPPLIGKSGLGNKTVVAAVQSASYVLPSSYDTVYACTKMDSRLKDYALIGNDVWAIRGRNVRIDDATNAMALRLHDIAYAIEQYFVAKKTYPTVEAMQAGQLAGLSMQELLDEDDKLLNTGKLTYAVEPENCSDCINYTLTYKTAANGIINLTDYARQAQIQ